MNKPCIIAYFFFISSIWCMEHTPENSALANIASTVSELDQAQQRSILPFWTTQKILESACLGTTSIGLLLAGIYLGTQCSTEYEQTIMPSTQCRAIAGIFDAAGGCGLVGTLLRILHRT